VKVSQHEWHAKTGWTSPKPSSGADDRASLVLVFGAPDALRSSALDDVKKAYPAAYICGCSTAGEISGDRVVDDTLTATAIDFDRSRIHASSLPISDPSQSFQVGRQLVDAIPLEGLVHVFVLSDGLAVNGSELVKGITSRLPAGVAVSGGLAGDGARFAATFTIAAGVVSQKQIVLVGFYGDSLRVRCGSMGGWNPFGPERKITRSAGNILFELDGHNVLDLYKEYLGQYAAELPASALRFPLALHTGFSEEGLVRTILAVNEQDKSMTFAGDMPEGGMARFMHANMERLIDGAAGAAHGCRNAADTFTPDLAVLVSCVGRKLVLKQRIEEEVESVREAIGAATAITGYYSYGEIAPIAGSGTCALHNETMTITTFTEV
jgi:hypothetical protein